MNKKLKKTEKFHWNLNIVLLLIYCMIPVIAITLIVLGSEFENNIELYMGFLLFPLMGILLIPNTIKYAHSECKSLDYKYKNRIDYLNNKFLKNENIDIYHSRILFSIIKNALISIIITIVIIFFIFASTTSFFENDGPSRLRERSIIRKVLHKPSNIEGGTFLLLLGSVVFGGPILIYNVIIYKHRISVILKKKYNSYYGKIASFDFKYNMRMVGKSDKYSCKIDSYKFIGIKKIDVINKEVILVFGLDNVYVFPTDK